MAVPSDFPGCADQLIDLSFGQVLTAAVVRVLQAERNFPVYDVWRGLDGELQDRVTAWCHCVNSPYKGLFTESFKPLPSSAVHTIYLGGQISKAKFSFNKVMGYRVRNRQERLL
jgi:hypothetical protein